MIVARRCARLELAKAQMMLPLLSFKSARSACSCCTWVPNGCTHIVIRLLMFTYCYLHVGSIYVPYSLLCTACSRLGHVPGISCVHVTMKATPAALCREKGIPGIGRQAGSCWKLGCAWHCRSLLQQTVCQICMHCSYAAVFAELHHVALHVCRLLVTAVTSCSKLLVMLSRPCSIMFLEGLPKADLVQTACQSPLH